MANEPNPFFCVNQIKKSPKKPRINSAGKGISNVASNFFSSNMWCRLKYSQTGFDKTSKPVLTARICENALFSWYHNEGTVTGDRNFDDIAHKFIKNIYGSGKGEIREAVVWQDLEGILARLSNSRALVVLDAGGGLAQLSQQVARRGHDVTLCDVSSKMLAIAKKDIEQAGLLPQYRFVHSSIQEIAPYITEPIDLLLFHAVMEWLSDPKAALELLLSHVKPGGIASVMFYNQNGLLFKNLICGNLTHIEQGMPHRKRFKLQPQKGFNPEDVYRWIEDAGFCIVGKSGVRTFYDYMKDTRVGDYTFEQVLSMEQALCRQEPFISLGRYIHVWAAREDDKTEHININNKNKENG